MTTGARRQETVAPRLHCRHGRRFATGPARRDLTASKDRHCSAGSSTANSRPCRGQWCPATSHIPKTARDTSRTTPPRHRRLTEQDADTAVDQARRMLRLPTIRAQFPELAGTAARDQTPYRGFFAELLTAECDDRARHRSEQRIKAPSPRGRKHRAGR